MTSEQQRLDDIGEKKDYPKPYVLRREGVSKPESWTVVRLGDIVELEYGQSLPKKEREPGPHPVFGSNGRSGWHSEYHIEAPGIIVGRKGVNLGIEWSDDDFNVIDTAYFINEDSLLEEDIDLRLLYYNLLDFDLDRLKSGSAVPGLNRNDFYEQTIPLPPKVEQERIADILDTLSDKIELNRSTNVTSEAIAQTIFQHWFVDSEPSNEYKTLENGESPEEWREGSLGELMTKVTNAVDPDELPDSTPYIGLRDMPEGSISLDRWGTTEEVSSRTYEFEKGQILFGRLRPYFCKVGIAPIAGVSSTDIQVVVPKEDDF